MIADVAGYTRMMERDDAGTLARLQEIRRDVIDPALSRSAGRVVKTAGDGFLAEFGSAIAALQRQLASQLAHRVRVAVYEAEIKRLRSERAFWEASERTLLAGLRKAGLPER